MTYEVTRIIAKNLSLGGTAYTAQDVTALNYLVNELKNNGLWPSLGAIYTFVGADAIAHSLNLLNPDANRLTFANDNVNRHTSLGYTPQSGAYGDTGFQPSAFGRNISLTAYVRTAASVNSSDFSSYPGTTSTLLCNISTSSGSGQFRCYSISEGITYTLPTANRTGLFVWTNNSGALSLYRNGAVVASGTVATTSTYPTQNFRLGNDASSGGVSTGRQYAWASLQPAMTASNQAIYSQIIQQFQTILGRAI